MVMWDIGGQESLRTSWVTYYTNAKVSKKGKQEENYNIIIYLI